jgi:DNA (cytosine-5)-methyltransferase 1
LRNARVLDLFSGAGGLSLGFKLAGAEITHAFEKDKWAAETYAHNFPGVVVIQKDITTINSSEIRTIIGKPPDLIVGGPPCQGFSHSNVSYKDPKDPRNSLFIDFIRFVDVLRPAICLMENVKGLLSTKTAERRFVIELFLRVFDPLDIRLVLTYWTLLTMVFRSGGNDSSSLP